MFFNLGRFSTLLCCIIFLMLASVPSANAQSSEALNRIDDAMQHLSDFLGKPISRENAQWRWTEKIFPDTSLECPATGLVYTQRQTRGFQVWITVDGTEYDYRLPAETEAVILCINGQPDRSSTGIILPEAPEETIESIEQTLETSAWWAWTYVIETDTLYLLNEDGEQASLPRPRLPNEQPNQTPKLAFSRDGRWLFIVNKLLSNIEAIGLYNIETGEMWRTYEMAAGETAYLGFSYDDSSIAASPYIVNADNSLLAIGLANTDFMNPSWRVVVIDLATGSPIYQLNNSNPLVTPHLPNNGSILFPRIVYFDDDALHIQFIQFAAGIAETHPALIWHPNANFVEPSPYIFNHIDILPSNQQAVFSYLDPNQDIAPTFGALNAIGLGAGDNPEQIYLDTTRSQTLVRWINGGSAVAFNSLADDNDAQWQAFVLSNQSPLVIDANVDSLIPLPDGYLTRNTDGLFTAFDTSGNSSPVWQAPESGHAIFLWATPLNSEFKLQSVYIPLNLTGIVHCPNTPTSIVAIGMNARVKQITGGSSLRLRTTAGGEYLLTMNAGTEFVVVSGPACQGDYTWWQVRLQDGTQGWAAEGDFSDYYIEPVPQE